jgi:type IV pilus assembly protein PilN
MIRINLLDWRAERREQRKQQFFTMLALAVVSAGTVLAGGVFAMNNAIDTQTERNDHLKAEIAEADRKIKEIEELEKVKSSLLARMQIIEELQSSRSATVHFFDELVRTLPEGVNLSSVKQTGNRVTIEGVAESNGRVSSYMKNLDASEWFADPVLVVIRTVEKDQQRESQFSLQVKKSVPGAAPTDGEVEVE